MFFHHLAENRALALWALLALIFMILEVIGTKNVLRSFFGIPERFSVFAVTGFNAVLGIYLMGLKEKKMQAKNLMICKEIREYYHDVENLVRDSFWNVYRPDCYEHYLLNQIRNDEDFVSDLDYVMFLNNKIIGQIIFMKALIKIDEGRNLDVMTIGPISIANDFKRQGYGKILIEYALEKAIKEGQLQTNIDCYIFSITNGIKACDTKNILKKFEKKGIIKKLPRALSHDAFMKRKVEYLTTN